MIRRSPGRHSNMSGRSHRCRSSGCLPSQLVDAEENRQVVILAPDFSGTPTIAMFPGLRVGSTQYLTAVLHRFPLMCVLILIRSPWMTTRPMASPSFAASCEDACRPPSAGP